MQRIMVIVALVLPTVALLAILVINPTVLRADDGCSCDGGTISHGKCLPCPPPENGKEQQCAFGQYHGCWSVCPAPPEPCVE